MNTPRRASRPSCPEGTPPSSFCYTPTGSALIITPARHNNVLHLQDTVGACRFFVAALAPLPGFGAAESARCLWALTGPFMAGVVRDQDFPGGSTGGEDLAVPGEHPALMRIAKTGFCVVLSGPLEM